MLPLSSCWAKFDTPQKQDLLPHKYVVLYTPNTPTESFLENCAHLSSMTKSAASTTSSDSSYIRLTNTAMEDYINASNGGAADGKLDDIPQ
eukprot:8982582-Ditylum_brightwellii.AAC.1